MRVGENTSIAEVADDGSCNCKWSRFHGLPCRHIFAVSKGRPMYTLPDSVVLPRWSADAPVRMSVPLISTTAVVNFDGTTHRSSKCHSHAWCMQLCSKVIDPLRRSGQLEAWLQDACRRVGLPDPFNASTSTGIVPVDGPVSTAPRVVTQATVVDNLAIRDPQVTKRKGRPPKGSKKSLLERPRKRWRSFMDKA